MRWKPMFSTWLLVWAVGLASANPARAGELKREVFGQTREGARVDLYTLTNARGMKASITPLGGIVGTAFWRASPCLLSR